MMQYVVQRYDDIFVTGEHRQLISRVLTATSGNVIFQQSTNEVNSNLTSAGTMNFSVSFML